MSDHYVGLLKGATGTKYSDFTVGTSSTSTLDFELRIADVDTNSVPPTRKQVMLALEAFERWVENIQQTTFPPL